MFLSATFLALFALISAGVTIRASRKNAVGVSPVNLGGYETALFMFIVTFLLFVGMSVSKMFSGGRFEESGVYISTVILQVLFSVSSVVFAKKVGISIKIGDIASSIKCGLKFFVACSVSVLSLGVSISLFYKLIFGESIDSQMAVEMFMNIDSVLVKILATFSIIILAPISEELFFRGLLYPSAKGWIASFLGSDDNFEIAKFKQKVSAVSAAVIVSILFSLIHSSAYAAFPLFVMGILLVCCYEKTNSILSPIIAHTLFNLINISMILLIPQ